MTFSVLGLNLDLSGSRILGVLVDLGTLGVLDILSILGVLGILGVLDVLGVLGILGFLGGLPLILPLVLFDHFNDFFPQLFVMFLNCLLKGWWNVQGESVVLGGRGRGRLALLLCWFEEPLDLGHSSANSLSYSSTKGAHSVSDGLAMLSVDVVAGRSQSKAQGQSSEKLVVRYGVFE